MARYITLTEQGSDDPIYMDVEKITSVEPSATSGSLIRAYDYARNVAETPNKVLELIRDEPAVADQSIDDRAPSRRDYAQLGLEPAQVLRIPVMAGSTLQSLVDLIDTHDQRTGIPLDKIILIQAETNPAGVVLTFAAEVA